jgi:hypothetical protein
MPASLGGAAAPSRSLDEHLLAQLRYSHALGLGDEWAYSSGVPKRDWRRLQQALDVTRLVSSKRW